MPTRQCHALLQALRLSGLLLPNVAAAFSQGAPICEVNQLPLVEMSPTLPSPPPSGWILVGERGSYLPGERLRLRVQHPDPAKRVRGVLIWAKRGPQSGSGAFLLEEPMRWQYLPAAAGCENWALTHRDATPKPQSQLSFAWEAGAAPVTILRAFVIEDCAASDCRAWQALSNLLILEADVFRDGFEAAATARMPTDRETRQPR
ncbi:MAG: hypothetical protein MUE46_08760 [Xanthomonadales bacterium]|jgi:hypothetical protein|nr:hypothetical protein [Xanthomonadales bacterium]